MSSSDTPSGNAPPEDPQEILATEGQPETAPAGYRTWFMRFQDALPNWLIVLFLAVLVIAPAGYFIHIPYYSVGPGPSVDVLTIIDVRGAKTYPSDGKLLLTTASVSVNTLNIWDALFAWVNPDEDLVPRSRLIGPGQTDREQDIVNQLQMEESKFAAEVVAFRALHLPITQIAGARILSVVPDRPAAGKLRPHDLIVSIDGKRVGTLADSLKLLGQHKAGDRVRIGFERDGVRHDVTMRTVQASATDKRAVIGVELTAALKLPHDIDIDTQQIVGPSGGMIFALAIYDAFTPGDLTHGHIIAGTGALGCQQNLEVVCDIGAIEEKVRAADAAGADVFVAPADQADAARKVAPKGMKVIGVKTLAQALRALQALKNVGG